MIFKKWASPTVSELASFVIGGDWGKDPSSFQDEEYEKVNCIRGSEIKNWKTDKGKTSSTRLVKISSLEKRRLKEGDILIEISGGGPDQPVGRTVLIDKKSLSHNELPSVCTNFLRLYRPVKLINSKFLEYFFQSFYLSGEIVNYQGGSNNLRNLKYKEFETIKIPLPPLSEQARIVAKLDRLFAHLDTLNQRLAKIPALLKDFRQAVLTQAVTGNGANKKIKEFTTKVGSGATPRGGSNSYRVEGIPLIRSMNVRFGGIKFDGMAFIDEKQASALKNVEVFHNDILLNITGASIGRVCLAPKSLEGGRVNQHVAIIRTTEEVLPQYLEIYLASPIIQDFIFNENYGATRQALTKTQILNIEVPIPSLQEQTEIVRRVEALFSKADRIEAQYESLKAKIDQLPQAILAKAFRGELVPQLPTDGDAKDLLAEIQQLQAELATKGKKSKHANPKTAAPQAK